jgi:signal transduction histidine kinase
MELKTKLSLLYSLITASVIMVFAVFIYLSAKQNRETEFYKVLNKEAITKVKLFLEAEVDDEILKEIYQSNKEIIDEVQVAIYDEAFNLIYHDDQSLDVVKENNEMLAQIVAENNISFYTDNWQVVGLLYSYNDKSYIVTATAYDQYGFNKLSSLLTTLVISFFISLVIVFLLGRFFAEQALLPIRNMNEQIKKITANSLNLRLVENESKDELAKLSTTFNEMLNRLENSFDAQKKFVSNISHELRTPLSAIITELEISSNRERCIAQYKEVISLCLKDAKKMTRLSNSLLDLAKASYDPTEISFKNTRVDEVIIEAASDLK